MTADDITAFVSGLPGVVADVADEASGAPEVAWGDTFFYYAPDGGERKMPFATIVIKDYDGFDTDSDLNRPDVFRLNVELGREKFEEVLGYAPAGHGTHKDDFDYAELDRLLPHPVYAPQGWASIVNPGVRCEKDARDLLFHAHSRAQRRYEPPETA